MTNNPCNMEIKELENHIKQLGVLYMCIKEKRIMPPKEINDIEKHTLDLLSSMLWRMKDVERMLLNMNGIFHEFFKDHRQYKWLLRDVDAMLDVLNGGNGVLEISKFIK